jgi:hypothetical protein
MAFDLSDYAFVYATTQKKVTSYLKKYRVFNKILKINIIKIKNSNKYFTEVVLDGLNGTQKPIMSNKKQLYKINPMRYHKG